MARRSIVLLAGFLVIFWDHISAQDQQQQTQDVSLGGVLVLTFQPFDRNKMFLVKRKEGEVTNIKVRTWSSWTAGSVPTLTDQASEDPAFDGRVESMYVSISNALTVQIKDFRATDTGPGVYYEFQQSGRRSQKFYPNIQTAPPCVPMFNIADVGEDFANISFQQVEPWDSAPVNYSVQYKETGDSSWRETQSVPHDPNASSETSRQILVQGLSSGVGYQFRVVSSNRFGSNFSHIEEARTKGPQNTVSGPTSRTRYFASIFIPIGISIGLVLVVSWCLHKRWKRSDQRDPENPEGQLTQDTPLQLLADPQQQPADPERQPLVAPVQDPADPERQPVVGPKQQPPVQPPAAAPGQQPTVQQPPAQQPTVQPPVAPGQSSSEDRSIIEPPRHHSEPGGGSSLRAVPDLVDGSPVKPQPLPNGSDIQIDAAPSTFSSGLEESFEHRVALYYDKQYYPDKSENKKHVLAIRGKLEESEFDVYDLYRDGLESIIDTFAYSVENCRHGIFFLPITTQMAKFKFNKFLSYKLSGDETPERNLILISLQDGDMEKSVASVKVYLTDAVLLHYDRENPETFDWRELFRRLASPGSSLAVEEAVTLVEGDSMSVEDLAKKLKIPQEVVDGLSRQFIKEKQTEELLGLWIGMKGPEVTRDALLKALCSEEPQSKQKEAPRSASGKSRHIREKAYDQQGPVGLFPMEDPPSLEGKQPMSTLQFNNRPTDKPGTSDLQNNAKDSPSLNNPQDQGPAEDQRVQHVEEMLSGANIPLDEETAKKLLKLLTTVQDWSSVQVCCGAIEPKLQLPGVEMLTAAKAKDLGLEDTSYAGMPEKRMAIKTTADGDCLFHAVGKLLRGGREEHTLLLRLGAVVFAVNHQECIVKMAHADLSNGKPEGDLSEADRTRIASFFAMASDGCTHNSSADLRTRLRHAVEEEARSTMIHSAYSGILPMMFLAGFVKHPILLYCQDPGYNNWLMSPCSWVQLDSQPQLEVMLVGTTGEKLNHYVGLIPTADEQGSPGNLTETDGNSNAEDHADEAPEVQDDIREMSLSFDSPPQKDNEATPLLPQPPQPDASVRDPLQHQA
ncbi:uncharacterized protein LOC144867310 isoform X2 [Branchiostoma floridae x Branchiostoma japonicum]